MRNRVWGLGVTILGTVAALLATSSGPQAQVGKSAEVVKAATGGGADLVGVWVRSKRPPDNARKYTNYELALSITTDEPPMTPWAKAKFDDAKPKVGPRAVPLGETNDPVINCFPPGVPRIYLQGPPVEIVQMAGRVLMLFEYDHFVRQIYTDGRPHAQDAAATWMGDSIGHWEGDALVVDTVGFNDKTWLDQDGHPHSDQLHLVERIRRPSHNVLTIDFTIEDPKAYTKSWAAHSVFDLKADWAIEEVVCEDNANFGDIQKRLEGGK